MLRVEPLTGCCPPCTWPVIANAPPTGAGLFDKFPALPSPQPASNSDTAAEPNIVANFPKEFELRIEISLGLLTELVVRDGCGRRRDHRRRGAKDLGHRAVAFVRKPDRS